MHVEEDRHHNLDLFRDGAKRVHEVRRRTQAQHSEPSARPHERNAKIDRARLAHAFKNNVRAAGTTFAGNGSEAVARRQKRRRAEGKGALFLQRVEIGNDRLSRAQNATANPMAPAPTTSTRSPGFMPERRTPCSATASGSASAPSAALMSIGRLRHCRPATDFQQNLVARRLRRFPSFDGQRLAHGAKYRRLHLAPPVVSDNRISTRRTGNHGGSPSLPIRPHAPVRA